MSIYNVEGREREYDDWVDPYQPAPSVYAPRPQAPPVAGPSVPAVNTGGGGAAPGTRRPSRPGFYEEYDGARWVEYSDAPGGAGPMQGGQGGGYTSADATGSGQFDYGRDPNAMLPFSAYSEMKPFSFSQGPFSYEGFKGSSWDDAEKEPGFEASQNRLAKMIQNTAAYRGILRSGATIGDLGTYLDQNKGQNFQQFDARNFRNWGANRDNAFGAWNANLGAEQFSYGQAATDNDRKNNYRFNTEKSSFDDILSRWTTLVNATTAASRPV